MTEKKLSPLGSRILDVAPLELHGTYNVDGDTWSVFSNGEGENFVILQAEPSDRGHQRGLRDRRFKLTVEEITDDAA